MNDLLLNDQQQLNVVFDCGNLPDVLLILMSVLVLFHQYNTENSHLIKTMVNRLKSICSNKILLDRDLNQLKESFIWSGYPMGSAGP